MESATPPPRTARPQSNPFEEMRNNQSQRLASQQQDAAPALTLERESSFIDTEDVLREMLGTPMSGSPSPRPTTPPILEADVQQQLQKLAQEKVRERTVQRLSSHAGSSPGSRVEKNRESGGRVQQNVTHIQKGDGGEGRKRRRSQLGSADDDGEIPRQKRVRADDRLGQTTNVQGAARRGQVNPVLGGRYQHVMQGRAGRRTQTAVRTPSPPPPARIPSPVFQELVPQQHRPLSPPLQPQPQLELELQPELELNIEGDADGAAPPNAPILVNGKDDEPLILLIAFTLPHPTLLLRNHQVLRNLRNNHKLKISTTARSALHQLRKNPTGIIITDRDVNFLTKESYSAVYDALVSAVHDNKSRLLLTWIREKVMTPFVLQRMNMFFDKWGLQWEVGFPVERGFKLHPGCKDAELFDGVKKKTCFVRGLKMIKGEERVFTAGSGGRDGGVVIAAATKTCGNQGGRFSYIGWEGLNEIDMEEVVNVMLGVSAVDREDLVG